VNPPEEFPIDCVPVPSGRPPKARFGTILLGSAFGKSSGIAMAVVFTLRYGEEPVGAL
jgi:hypothetical protein